MAVEPPAETKSSRMRSGRSLDVAEADAGAGQQRLLDLRGDAPMVIAGDVVLGHGVFDRLSLADEIEHHHRVREQRDQR